MGRDFFLFRMSPARGLPVSLLSPQVEDVVTNLEGQAQLCAELRHCLRGRLLRRTHHGSKLCRAAYEGGGLAVYHLEIGVLRDVHALLVGQVKVLPFAEAQAGLVKEANGFQRALRRHTLVRLSQQGQARKGVHPVAGVDGLGPGPTPTTPSACCDAPSCRPVCRRG